MVDVLEILRPKTQFGFCKYTAKEFPVSFDFGPEHHGLFMGRAARRRMELGAHKVVKKKAR